MKCYITRTGSFLPGEPVDNASLPLYLGDLEGEESIRKKILRMNGIKLRYYALDHAQNPTHDVYELAALAAERCLGAAKIAISYLSAGSTNTPWVAPGISSHLHARLAQRGLVSGPVEINSNSGICTSSSQALINASRAVQSGDHRVALCVGVDQPSDILKSSVIQPPDDRDHPQGIAQSKWFMSVFLRSMLSDGAGAFLLQDEPSPHGISYKMNWSHSRSFANEAPRCMTLDNRTLLLSQDVNVLAQHMEPCVRQMIVGAFAASGEEISDYRMILPHLSSLYFKRLMHGVVEKLCKGQAPDYWTNLETSGNTGAASIFILLDAFTRARPPAHGDKILLFIPESGQFNFVMVSLTAIHDAQPL